MSAACGVYCTSCAAALDGIMIRALKPSFDVKQTSIVLLSYTTTMTTDSKVISAPDEDLGFPAGYFVLRNTGSDRMLDIDRGSVDDGAEVLLFPEKEKSLVEGAYTASCFVLDWWLWSELSLERGEASGCV